MSLESDLLRHVAEICGGAVIGIALLGQYLISVATARAARSGSGKEKFIAFGVRIGSAILSFSVLILVVRAVRAYSNLTILDALAVAIGLALVAGIAWRQLSKRHTK